MKRVPRGFVLAVVLAALLLTMMVVALAAQRALLASRQAGLALDRVELEAASVTARVELLSAALDTGSLNASPPGSVLANGTVTTGLARADWAIVAARPPFAMAEIRAQRSTAQGAARSVLRAVLTIQHDSAGLPRWSVLGSAGWVKLPSS